MTKLIQRCAEFIHQDEVGELPKRIRGIYVLYKKRLDNVYDVVYVGMTRQCAWSRINAHAKSKRKKNLWTHFSLFEVNYRIGNDMIKDLEGLIRHIYRNDSHANAINKARRYAAIRKVRVCKGTFKNWNR